MTLPLQPMSTAHRDGREVLIVLNTGEKQIVEWVGENPNWVTRNMWTNGCDNWIDESIEGWLDLPALVQDSARLTKLIDRFNYCESETISDLFDAAYEIAAHSNEDTEDYQKWVRAAIDKERERG